MSTPRPRWMVEGLWALAGGVFWSMFTFAIDTYDSYRLVKSAARRIRSDDATTEMVEGAVTDYVLQIASGHLVLGFFAGLLLLAMSRLWFPRALPGALRWLAHMSLLCTPLTLWLYLRGALMFPPLHDWLGDELRRRWADGMLPQTWDGVGLALASAALLAAALRGRTDGAKPASFVRGLVVLAVALGVGWLGLHHPRAKPAKANAGPNVVIVSIDAMRIDRLKDHGGYHRDTAPNLDAILAESLVFTNTWTPLARTYPAWTSILTGELPITHGIRDNLPQPQDLVPPHRNLPQAFVDQGWGTAFVTDDSRFSYMVPETGFTTIAQPPVGPQNFAVSVFEPRFRMFHSFMHNPLGFALVPVMAWNQSFGKSYHPELFWERAADVLADMSAEHERFFYAVHSCVLHAPGDRVYPWYRMYDQVGYKGGNRFRYSRSGTAMLEGEQEDYLKNMARKTVQDNRIYDSGIDMADKLVARVVEQLKHDGLWDNTVLILLSDHGEEMWDEDLPYGYFGPNHGFHVYGEAQFKVLMSVRFPPGMEPKGYEPGKHVSDAVRLIDLAPTLAELYDLDFSVDTVEGKSLLPLIAGVDEPEDRPIFVETGLSEPRYWVPGHVEYPFTKVSERYRIDVETGRVHIRSEFQPHLIAAKDRALIRGKWKLIWHAMESGVRVSLFDQEADPLNRNELSGEMPVKTAELAVELIEYLRRDGIEHQAFETFGNTWARHNEEVEDEAMVGPGIPAAP